MNSNLGLNKKPYFPHFYEKISRRKTLQGWRGNCHMPLQGQIKHIHMYTYLYILFKMSGYKLIVLEIFPTKYQQLNIE